MEKTFLRLSISNTLHVVLLLTTGFMFMLPWTAGAAEQQTNYKLREKDRGAAPKESIFDLTFGSPRRMATERGILVIDAFFDSNGNLAYDPDEDMLNSDVSCKLDGINYPVPAFIPGLEYQETFELTCEGQRYSPQLTEDMVFIRKRGQVLKVSLPCWLQVISPNTVSLVTPSTSETK